MTGRASVFADPEIIRLANRSFIPVTADDWYQRRREDAEGRFWRRVADQGPRRGVGSGTRQGIYCFTADGQLLAHSHHHRDPAIVRDRLNRALQAFAALPLEQRRPGAVRIEEPGNLDTRYLREPPKGGLVLRTYTRILDRKKGELCKGSCGLPGGDFAARDHVWLTAQEWKALIPTAARQGDAVTIPEGIAMRLARFHLVDNTRGEPPHWARKDVRSLKITAMIEEAGQERWKLRLEGSAVLTTDADPKRAERGFEARLLGWIEFDPAKRAITRFDVIAVGDHWGEGPYTRGARPGRNPLGIVFELARGDEEADRVPPQAARTLTSYFQADR